MTASTAPSAAPIQTTVTKPSTSTLFAPPAAARNRSTVPGATASVAIA
jgi:hypothetical protein